MNIFNTPSPEEFVAAIERQLAHIANSGSGDVIRLRKEVQRTPEDPEQWFELGIALNQAGLQYRDLALQLADFHYRQEHPEIDDQPSDQPYTLQIDDADAMDLFGQALDALDHVERLSPDYYGLQCQKGMIHGNMHNYPLAEQCYLQALRDDDEDFSAAYYLGITYRNMGDETLAEKYLALANQLNPEP